ncbi:DUF3139 domain-containing protein [Fictibacillus aquaticus]|uniref:DUF3139 domain-containing protein n=1 Tax=Fictibacillus aquaticus TaxID=2021314 RepID=UPI0013FDFA7E|nr:DUF3139 domain-containing protein [Fictibacillus aquaticus]
MKKVIVFLLISTAFIFTIAFGTKYYFTQYEKQTDERIEKVIEFQGATRENIEREYVNYNKTSDFLGKTVYFKDDPGIEYQYLVRRGQNRVLVSAKQDGVPLENIKKRAKFPTHTVEFDENNEIVKVTDWRTNKVLYKK